MNKYLITLGFVCLFFSGFVSGISIGLIIQEPVLCVQTQNYLSTPYLANPNNQFVDAELEIITVPTQSLNTS